MKRTILVTGSTIGLALAEKLAEDANVAKVILTWHRTTFSVSSNKIELRQADLTCESSIEELLGGIEQLDGIVNTFGILHGEGFAPEKSIRQLNTKNLMRAIEANCAPTLVLAKHAGPLLRKSPNSVFISLSARVGSIGDNRIGGWHSYRISKAALNMAIKNIAIEWARTMPRCCVAALHPGTVETALSEPFVKAGNNNVVPPSQCATNLKAVIDQLKPDKSGCFLAWDGTEIPW